MIVVVENDRFLLFPIFFWKVKWRFLQALLFRLNEKGIDIVTLLLGSFVGSLKNLLLAAIQFVSGLYRTKAGFGYA